MANSSCRGGGEKISSSQKQSFRQVTIPPSNSANMTSSLVPLPSRLPNSLQELCGTTGSARNERRHLSLARVGGFKCELMICHQADSQSCRQKKGSGADGFTRATLRANPTLHGLSCLQLVGSSNSVKLCRQRCLECSPGLVHCQVAFT